MELTADGELGPPLQPITQLVLLFPRRNKKGQPLKPAGASEEGTARSGVWAGDGENMSDPRGKEETLSTLERTSYSSRHGFLFLN